MIESFDSIAEEFVLLQIMIKNADNDFSIMIADSSTNKCWDLISFEKNPQTQEFKNATYQVKSCDWKKNKAIVADFSSMKKCVDYLFLVIFNSCRNNKEQPVIFQIPFKDIGEKTQKCRDLVQNHNICYRKSSKQQTLSIATIFDENNQDFMNVCHFYNN